MAEGQCGNQAERKAIRGALVALAGQLLLAIVLLAGCRAPEVPDERLVRFVDELVFGGPFDAHKEQDKRITRWSGEMRVAIMGPGAKDYREPLAGHLASMADLSGLDARMIAAGDQDANVMVELVDELDFLVNREYANCYVRKYRRKNRIYRAKVYIGMAEPEGFRRCLVHELMHVFGFGYHSGIVRSALSPVHREAKLTEWDELALRVLFDSRLEVGAPRDQTLPIIRQIIREDRIGN
jgi:hypothetical protein